MLKKMNEPLRKRKKSEKRRTTRKYDGCLETVMSEYGHTKKSELRGFFTRMLLFPL